MIKILLQYPEMNELNMYVSHGVQKRSLNNGRVCCFPSQDWIPLLPSQKSTLLLSLDRNQPRLSETVFIFRLKDPERTDWLEKDLLLSLERKEQGTLWPRIESLLAELKEIGYHSIAGIDVRILSENTISTALDAASCDFLGMHLDSHPDDRSTSRSLRSQVMGINVGKCVRYFQFVDLAYEGICQKIANESMLKVSYLKTLSMPKLVDVFFSCFPDHPIYRVEVPSFFGYLFPSQNMIHDGSTNSKGVNDMVVLIRGMFFWN